MLKSFRVSIVLACLLTISACSAGVMAIKGPGTNSAPNMACTAILKISPQGGFLQLYIQSERHELTHIADDITGIVWVGANSLAFSSSPIYGKPGVFLVGCDWSDSPRLTILAGPKNVSSVYPEGADYFELKSIKGNDLEFFYGEDVDSIDFKQFRSDRYLRSVKILK